MTAPIQVHIKKYTIFLAAAVLLVGGLLFPPSAYAGNIEIGAMCSDTIDCVSGASCSENICVADSFGTVDVGASAGLGGGDLRTTIGKIINVSLSFLGVVAVGIILFGGFMYMTAGGSDEKVGTAKKIMINGVIGLVLILASFAIARFILSALGGSTGSGSVSNGDTTPACQEADGICDLPSTGDPESCLANYFVAESITPNQGNTGMSNVRIRAVFSNPVATRLEDIFIVEQDGVALPKTAFTSTFVVGSDNRVVEATYAIPDGTCATSPVVIPRPPVCDNGVCPTVVVPPMQPTALGCLPPGKQYKVRLSPNIEDASGKKLENEEASAKCGGALGNLLKDGAVFTVDKKENDTTKPAVSAALIVNGEQTTDPLTKLPVGQGYAFTFTATDNSGIGYVHAKMTSSVGGSTVLDSWYGPVSNSHLAFTKQIPFSIGSSVVPGTEFTITIDGQDIDHQATSTQLKFSAVGSSCGNGVMDGDETAADTGGSCGGGAGEACRVDANCTAGSQCVSNVCVPAPYITKVTPMDGASGNWITVSGKNFGNTKGSGKVEFGVTGTSTPFSVATWYSAEVVNCQGAESWSDTSIIVQVPDDVGTFLAGSQSAIRVTDTSGKVDTTINTVGYIPLPDGRFTKNTTKRPGLCSVLSKSANVGQALPKEPVNALGKSFGTQKDTVLFGDIQAQTAVAGNTPQWQDNKVEALIPASIAPASVPVQIQVGDERSNPVYFTVNAQNAITVPIISSIDPVSTTPLSYITIRGTGFGNNGLVYFANQKGLNCPGDGCVPGITSLDAICRDTWTPTQVIVQVPAESALTPGNTYFVVLKNSDNNKISSGQESINITAGEPLPSICALSPSKGPAPLPSGSTLQILGKNFRADPIVYFYKKGVALNDLSAWFSSITNQTTIEVKNGNEIISHLPVDVVTGASMPTGPIKVSVGGRISNSVVYEVQDCTVPGVPSPGVNFQCCSSEGPDKGMWKPKEQMCTGESRIGGYVWRFSTGVFPQIPRVEEYCQADASPSPWINQGAGANACVNAEITVNFNIAMDATTLNTNNIKVISCGTGEKSDCTNKTDVPIGLDITGNNRIEASATAGDFAPNTWYRVELNTAIKSFKQQLVAGKITDLREPLLITRPCGGNTAYCFEFKTGTGQCDIKEVGVHPKKHTTTFLGVVQDPSWPFDSLVNNPSHPLVFGTWAAANQACIMLDTDSLLWNWTTENAAKATATALTTTSFAHAKAILDTPAGVELRANTNYNTKAFQATSTLVIELLEPKAQDFEPNCAESCVNPRIRVAFNRQMSESTFDAGFYLYKCSDANCLDFSSTAVSASVDSLQSTMTELVAYPAANLLPSTYYKVVLTDAIKTVIGFNGTGSNATEVKGKGITTFSWVFKTQNNATACSVNNVSIAPNPFTADSIGQKVEYTATPFSSPNACSKYGQALNKWDYKYTWETMNTSVATVTNFPHIKLNAIHPACNIACVPRGSDISSDKAATDGKFLCGNGTVDPGEDCDYGTNGANFAGCSLNCLRTGNSDTSTCGNGIIESSLGEFCDPATLGMAAYCSNTCLPLGSSAFNAGTPGASFCGDGQVTNGEACDIGLETAVYPNMTKTLCTNNCLHMGTTLASSWCENHPSYAVTPECKAAVSVCGNGKLEKEEECEKAPGSGEATMYMRDGQLTVINIDPKIFCSNNCRIQNACQLTEDKLTTAKNFGGIVCDPNTEGCTQECRIGGASTVYSTPSLCGDGVVGKGEYGMCETGGVVSGAGSSPVQVVTAVGQKQPASAMQTTTIKVTLTSTSTFVGTGDFALQCGYSEYVTPKVSGGVASFNGCSNAQDGVSNVTSCCMPRPVRQNEYPVNGAGFGGTTPACPNTVITATFSKEIKEDSLPKNILLARGYTQQNYVCSSTVPGSFDVTEAVKTVAYGTSETPGFFKKLWTGIKDFFAKLFGMEVLAENPYSAEMLSQFKTWCTTGETVNVTGITLPPATGKPTTTTLVSVSIDKPLAGLSTYAVLLHGGTQGILDVDGVGIRNPDKATTLDDMWVFKTKKDLCKITAVSVTPANFTFVSPDQKQKFLAVAKTKDNEQIQSTNAYSWDWSWNPEVNPVFHIPAPSTATGTPIVQIQPKGPQGTLAAVGSARVTVDMSESGGTVGQSFGGITNLTAAFCENPWPGYANTTFNFNFNYCPDAGKTGNKNDDLPFLTAVDVTEGVGDKKYECALNQAGFTPISCTTNTDCESVKLLNLPFDDGNKEVCKTTTNAAVLKANNCSVYNFTGYTGFCDTDSQYAPQYGETYRGCNTNADCKTVGGKAEICTKNLTNPGWKVVSNSCIEVANTSTTKILGTGVLKKVLFTSDKTSDAIGLQIFKNDTRKSAEKWFVDEFGGAGKIQSINIAGYEGITDGANYYINALNINNNTQVYNNIYLLSINSDAQDDTKAVLGKILDSLTFNNNLTDYGYCQTTGATNPQSFGSITCRSDFDCRTASSTPLTGTNGVCSNEKTKFLRDWKRLSDIKEIQSSLIDYKNTKGSYPELKSGSFVQGYSLSKWSSWGDMGVSLGGLPVDPLNTWTQCSGQDQETCWNPTASTFSCPGKASVYEYEFFPATKEYILHVPFEYFNINNLKLEEFIPNPTLITSAPKCVPAMVYSAFSGGSCGDGIVQPGEQCDPVGKKIVTSCSTADQFKEETCSASCTWTTTAACSFGSTCGNGKIENGESCDDGGSNGKYGYCNAACSGPDTVAGYCGNNKIDNDASGKPIEQCDSGLGGLYALAAQDSCSALCTKPGGYCGDTIKQAQEECDFKDPAMAGVCTTSCKIKNIACLKAGATYHYEGNATIFSLTNTSTVAHIPACMENTTGNAICFAAGGTCLSVVRNFPGSKAPPIDCGIDLTGLATTYPATTSTFEVRCDGIYQPNEQTAPVVTGLSCGNGKIDAGEMCDESGNNGKQCTPAYGKSCTYCANDCKKILTVDTLAFCGNGKIDAGEVCDYTGTADNQTKVFTTSTPSGNGLVCGDKGTYKCTASCTYIESNCVSCTQQKDKPVPKLAIITPMTDKDLSPYSNAEYLDISRPSKITGIGYRKINFKAISTPGNIYYDYNNLLYISPFAPLYLIVDNYNDPILDMGIETSPLCKDEYKIFFNRNSVQGNGDHFPYPVNGEPAIVSNEVIMSPAVNKGVYRVVVKWTAAEEKKGVAFVGAAYTQNRLTTYAEALSQTGPDIYGKDANNVCRFMATTTGNYWMPNNCWGYLGGNTKPSAGVNGGIYIHPKLGAEKTFVQSFTFDMDKMSNSKQPLGFVVQAIGGSTTPDEGPIYPYRMSENVKVEVYEYHEGQNPQDSIYLPTEVYSISTAGTKQSNPNKSAKYWHVFNIMNDGSGNYSVQGVEEIETAECQVAKNLPGPASLPPGCV